MIFKSYNQHPFLCNMASISINRDMYLNNDNNEESIEYPWNIAMEMKFMGDIVDALINSANSSNKTNIDLKYQYDVYITSQDISLSTSY